LEMCRKFEYLGHGGGPDLLLVRTWSELTDAVFDEEREELLECDVSHPDFRGEARFVEVKSENDRLSNKQIFWLNTLKLLGIPCEVLKVSVSGKASVCRTPASTMRRSQKPKGISNRGTKKPRSDIDVVFQLGMFDEEEDDDIFEEG
jgi:hypothetical protein